MLGRLAGAAIVLCGAAAVAHADRIVRIKVTDITKTDRNTVLAIAGFEEGSVITELDLEKVKQRLLASGLFKEVKVSLENAPGGVNLLISAKDKISWFILPTFAYSEDNYGGGLAFGETNLFGRHKRLLLYAALSNTTGTLLAAYQDPALGGSWFYWQLDGHYQWDKVREYFPMRIEHPWLLRTMPLQVGGGGLNAGVRWWRKFKTEGRFGVRQASFEEAKFHDAAWDGLAEYNSSWGNWRDSARAQGRASASDPNGTNLYARGTIGWDGRSSVHGVQDGLTLLGSYEGGFGAFAYWKAWINFHWALKIRKEHNFMVRAYAGISRDVPFFEEFESGGSGLRGYLTRQFRGDTRGFASVEYVFPIVKLWGLHIRGLAFYDTNLSWFSQPPDCRPESDGGPRCRDGYPYAERISDGGKHVRYYLPGQYFSLKLEAFNMGVGAGLRFYLKAIAMPLIGVDYGYGIEGGGWGQVYLTVGMPL
ncbi:MAG: BamA/TamA family outer membrane protein [Deltaproteobacteria bacterium]|nr:BamA/TamA family outer membrane protein [Deltaproteobacteria bacterium]